MERQAIGVTRGDVAASFAAARDFAASMDLLTIASTPGTPTSGWRLPRDGSRPTRVRLQGDFAGFPPPGAPPDSYPIA